MESHYLPGPVSLPISLLEIILFVVSMLLLFEVGGRYRLWLGSFLLVFVVCSIASRFWPPPKFDLPTTPISARASAREDPSKANFVWSSRYRVRFWFHIFPARKYGLLHDRAVEENILTLDDFIQPNSLDDSDLRLVHGRGYLYRLYFLGITRLGLLNGENPITINSLKKLKTACGGTYLACKIALEQGLGMNLCGGFHHAFPCREAGFCHLNDMAVAIRKLQMQRAIDRAMVIDCDVHQGNGTAAIFAKDDSVFTFSIHQEDLYPHPKAIGDYDISLNSNLKVDDETYLEKLNALEELIKDHRPDLIIYLAGADPFVEDRLGGFLLSKEGLMARDAYILGLCNKLKIPTAIVLGGGYARNTADTVEIHLNTIRVVSRLLENPELEKVASNYNRRD
ncbi:MAG: histone deacetylase [Syntrophobacterales bacterium]|jgi:acetoin utilization deacetylase AcuC-like enzyme